MKRIALTGAGGFLGQFVCAQLLSQNHFLRILILPQEPIPAPWLNHPLIEIHRGDITHPTSLVGFCQDVDRVIHMAGLILSTDSAQFQYVNTQGTQNLLELINRESPNTHFVYISSISVTYPTLNPYALSKLAAEKEVQNKARFWTIIRPSLLVAPQGSAELALFVKYFANKFVLWPGLWPPFKSPITVHDLASNLSQLSWESRDHQQIYAWGGSQPIRLDEMARDLGAKWIIKVPLFLCLVLAAVLDRLPFGSFSFTQALAAFRFDAIPSSQSTETTWKQSDWLECLRVFQNHKKSHNQA